MNVVVCYWMPQRKVEQASDRRNALLESRRNRAAYQLELGDWVK